MLNELLSRVHLWLPMRSQEIRRIVFCSLIACTLVDTGAALEMPQLCYRRDNQHCIAAVVPSLPIPPVQHV